MQISFLSHILSLPVLVLFANLLSAQSPQLSSDISNWYLEERFIIADQNDDALLSKAEIKVFADEFCYYLADRYFELADRNQDGFLSFNEISLRKKSEYLFRTNLERKNLRSLTESYPLLAQADENYLKSNPELVRSLFTNLVWLCENAELAAQIVNDRAWNARNPEVMISLHRNLRWMVANPDKAKDLYRDRLATQQLPELLSWRADHKDFIRRYALPDRFYELEFIPASVRMNE
ncbi:MAG: EF-hand domain-containing protein [Bacteroidia bacterium]